jgi:hypothetical protein
MASPFPSKEKTQMAYDDKELWQVANNVAIAQAATYSVFKYIVPANGKSFSVQRAIVSVGLTLLGAVATQLKIWKTPAGGSATLLKTLTAFAGADAVGTVREDEVLSISGLSNVFGPGDTLDIQTVTATNTGTLNIALEVGRNN